VARHPMTMGELADMLGIDRPNATTVVDDLEKRGLVRRVPHPTDRRAKIVEATRKGHALAQRAESILGTPPTTLAGLSKRDLETLRRILSTAAQSGG
jgi:DNA-binding MarR family transcriptional regulator